MLKAEGLKLLTKGWGPILYAIHGRSDFIFVITEFIYRLSNRNF